MFKKYTWNFIFIVLIVSFIGFIIFDVVFYSSMKNFSFQQTLRETHTRTQLAVKLLEREGLSSLLADIPALYDLTYQIRNVVNARITIIDIDGRVLTDSDVARDRVQFMDNHSTRPEVIQAKIKGSGQSYRKSDTLNRHIFYSAVPLQSDGQTRGFLRLAYYSEYFEESMSSIITFLITANIIGLLILFIVAYFLARVVIAPISQTVQIAHQISMGDFDKKFTVTRKDEIGHLSLILNQLTCQLKSQIKQISTERGKLQNILNNLDLGILVIDQHRSILHANPEIFRMMKVNPTTVENKTVIEILRVESLLDAIDNVLKSGEKTAGEFVYNPGNEKLYLSYVITPFHFSEENQNGALIQIQDVTSLKKLEAIRRDFVVNASHELKTPLTAIVGYTETLIDGAANDPKHLVRFIRRIREQAQRLEFLVADLLKLSQLENDLPLELKKVNIIPLLNEISNEFNDLVKQKGLHLSVESPKKNVFIKADKELLRIVFNNLIDNAIKYTSTNGKITICVSEKNDRVKLEVFDTGIGIEAKYHERIFQRFYRVDKARSLALGGTGLGLAIVKHIIEKHHSEIFVESQLGQGSRFWFELEKA